MVKEYSIIAPKNNARKVYTVDADDYRPPSYEDKNYMLPKVMTKGFQDYPSTMSFGRTMALRHIE